MRPGDLVRIDNNDGTVIFTAPGMPTSFKGCEHVKIDNCCVGIVISRMKSSTKDSCWDKILILVDGCLGWVWADSWSSKF
jgi:hypothetical protein